MSWCGEVGGPQWLVRCVDCRRVRYDACVEVVCVVEDDDFYDGFFVGWRFVSIMLLLNSVLNALVCRLRFVRYCTMVVELLYRDWETNLQIGRAHV